GVGKAEDIRYGLGSWLLAGRRDKGIADLRAHGYPGLDAPYARGRTSLQYLICRQLGLLLDGLVDRLLRCLVRTPVLLNGVGQLVRQQAISLIGAGTIVAGAEDHVAANRVSQRIDCSS